jgi:hypothetical protein
MNNPFTDSCGILNLLKSGTGGFNRQKSNEVLGFHCGTPGHTRAEYQSSQRGLEALHKVTKRSTKHLLSDANIALTQY